MTKNVKLSNVIKSVSKNKLSLVLFIQGDNGKILENIKNKDSNNNVILLDCISGKSLIEMLSDILNLHLDKNDSARNNYFIIERFLKESSYHVIVLDKIESFFESVDEDEKMAFLGQLIFLNKRMELSFIFSGNLNKENLEYIEEKMETDLVSI